MGPIDLDVTSTLLAETVVQLRELAVNLSNGLRTALDARDEEDKQVLDVLLSDSEECHQLTDRLMDEIVKRFDLLSEGEVTRNRQGWPLVWSGRWPVEERAQFLKAISRFSSNFAPFFGRLLTPLVNGVRVAGPLLSCVDEWPETEARAAGRRGTWTHAEVVVVDQYRRSDSRTSDSSWRICRNRYPKALQAEDAP